MEKAPNEYNKVCYNSLFLDSLKGCRRKGKPQTSCHAHANPCELSAISLKSSTAVPHKMTSICLLWSSYFLVLNFTITALILLVDLCSVRRRARGQSSLNFKWKCKINEYYLLGDMLHSNISPIVSVRIFISIYLSIFIYYCMNFVARLSQEFLWLWYSNFHSIFALIRNRHIKLFNMITQPWRHPGAILWIHVIIHIFITVHSKSTIFNAHKLQAICQHIGLFISGLYQIRARARASKFRNAQNHL